MVVLSLWRKLLLRVKNIFKYLRILLESAIFA